MRGMFLLWCVLASPAPAFAVDRPHVVFIVADDLSCELGCYGSPALTPNLDALAKQSLRFDRAYCQQAVCNPSRSSFLTGKRPDTLHLYVNGTHFRERNPDVQTLPGAFKAAGYETRCYGKIFHNWHTKEKGDRRSWSADEFLHYATHGADTAQVQGALPANTLRVDAGRMYGDVPLCECRDVADDAYFDGRVATAACQAVATIGEQPTFLAVGFWKPHAPFNAPKKYWDMIDPARLPPLVYEKPKNAPALAFHDSREILGIPPQNIQPTQEQIQQMRHGYFANIAYMDAQVGKVLQAIKKRGIEDKTIIIFVADHGYHMGEQTLFGKTSNFERDARVPLMIAGPGVRAGQVTRGLVELIDLFPTLIEMAGLPKQPGLDGTSLVPLLKNGSSIGKNAAFTQHPRPAYADRTPTGLPDAMGTSIRTDHIRYTQWRRWGDGQLLAEEWYDHRTDAQERVNTIETVRTTEIYRQTRAALERQFPADIPPAKR
jgi:iduronate 2-sulfatase